MRGFPLVRLIAIVLSMAAPAAAADVYETLVLSDMPAAYYRLDELAGTTAELESRLGDGSVGDGTYTGSPTLAQIPPFQAGAGKAVSFAASGDYVVVSTSVTAWESTMFALDYSFSVEFFVRFNTYADDDVLLDGPSWRVITRATNSVELDATSTFGSCDPASVSDASIAPVTGWHHVVFTFDDASNAWRTYVDGAAIVSTTCDYDGPAALSGNLYIGAATAGADDANARMDEVAIYKYALTADQVLTHYRARNACIEAGGVMAANCQPAAGQFLQGLNSKQASFVGPRVQEVYFSAAALSVDGTHCTKNSATVYASGARDVSINCATAGAGEISGSFKLPDDFAGGPVRFAMFATPTQASPGSVTAEFLPQIRCQCVSPGSANAAGYTGEAAKFGILLTAYSQYDDIHEVSVPVACTGTCASSSTLNFEVTAGLQHDEIADIDIRGITVAYRRER